MSEGPAWDTGRCRQRMEEDGTRFAELDLRLDEAARNIGQQPLAPPTLRGRFGALIVQVLRNLLWWYGLPLKEAVAQIGLRNREQAVRHRLLQEDLLGLSQRIELLDQAFNELPRRSGADCQTAIGLLSAQLQAEVNAREVLAAVVNDQGDRIGSARDSLAVHLQANVDALGAAVRSQGDRIEQVNGALSAQVQAEVHAREVLAGVVDGQGNRIEQVNGDLMAQVQAEVHAREILAGVVNGQGNRIEQVNGALSAQAEAEAHAREALNSFVNDQADKLEKVAGGVEPLAALPGRVSNLAVAHDKQRAALLEQEHRIGMFLREVRHQLPEPLSKTQVQQFTEASANAIGVLYAEFEDTFRGPREVIKERQEVYIRPLKEAKVGAKSAPVLDLGCGRGEWLELLAEHQFVARGVDSNPGMIERCRALGMNVTLSEALAYLRGLPDRSIGAVTSFHMVEHMPFEDVVSLLDQALRVLRSGGVLILETPNPQNVLVGSQTFWIDPTHLKPIPSQTLRFFAEARGFCGAEIWNLQQYPDAIRIPEDSSGTATRFNDYFYGPQDYGLIARRP